MPRGVMSAHPQHPHTVHLDDRTWEQLVDRAHSMNQRNRREGLPLVNASELIRQYVTEGLSKKGEQS